MGLRLVRSNPTKKNPLKRGKSRKVIAGNIRNMEREGYPKKQAVAASLRKAGVKRRVAKKNPRKRRKKADAVLFGFKQSGLKPTIGNFRSFAVKNGGKSRVAPLGTYIYEFSDNSVAVVGKGKVVVL